MKPPRLAHLLVRRSTHELVAIQDSFGPAYRCLRAKQPAGFVGEVIIDHLRMKRRSVNGDGTSPSRFVVIRPVHANTVRALLRRSGEPITAMARGHWHEVISE